MKVKVLGVDFKSKKEVIQCLGLDSFYEFRKLNELDIAALLNNDINREALTLRLQKLRDEFRAKQREAKNGI